MVKTKSKTSQIKTDDIKHRNTSKEERLERIKIPEYKKGEEIFNMVTHIVGGGIGIAAVVLCVIMAVLHHNVYGVISGAIFGGTMIILYCMSSIYHGLNPNLLGKKVFRVLDHCTIYLLIAGTYTPFALCVIRQSNEALGWVHFGVVWAICAVGILMNAINLEKFRVLSMILYFVMSFCILLAFKNIFDSVGIGGMTLLLTGGAAYSFGAIFYGLEKKKAYMHSIFHMFILIGSILHLLCILFYVM